MTDENIGQAIPPETIVPKTKTEEPVTFTFAIAFFITVTPLSFLANYTESFLKMQAFSLTRNPKMLGFILDKIHKTMCDAYGSHFFVVPRGFF